MTACNAFDRELPIPGGPADAPPGEDAGVDAAEQPVDADVSVDASDPLGCDLAKPFGEPVAVPGLASAAQDASLRLSPDEKTAYFFSTRSGGGLQLLYTASRARVGDAFTNVAALANVNAASQYNPSISADGLTLFFASFRTGTGGGANNDIYRASREAVTADFVNPRLVANVNTTGSEVQPYVTHDSTTMYFVRTVASRNVIFRAVGSVSNGFLNPGAVSEVAGPTNDSDPVQSADGLTLFWASDRPGGLGDVDVWQATRATTSAPFANPTPVTSVNTRMLDAPSDVSEDGCRLYMTSSRDGRTAIYVATRPQ